jgi:hypothetical protein
MPGTVREMIRPRRLKCGQAHRRSQCNFALAPHHASLWDATAFVHCPGNELPGYYRSVPTGQIPQAPMAKALGRPRFASCELPFLFG